MGLLVLSVAVFAIVTSLVLRAISQRRRIRRQLSYFGQRLRLPLVTRFSKDSLNPENQRLQSPQFFSSYSTGQNRAAPRPQSGLSLSKQFVALHILFIALTMAAFVLIRPTPLIQAQGPLEEINWDNIDWNPPGTLIQSYMIGSGNVTITFDLDLDCAEQNTPDDNSVVTGGLTITESLAIVVNYDNAGCTQEFVGITIFFDHPGGVTNVTVPILDIDFRTTQYSDTVEITATDGSNTFQVNDPNTQFTIVSNTVVAFNGLSTFSALSTTQVPNDQPFGNVFVTFNQPNLQTITLRYTNGVPDNNLSRIQGISFGIIGFRPLAIPGQPNLVITKTVEPTGFVSPNDPLTYTIVVLNNGDTRATDVTISDTLPSEVTPVSASVEPSGNGSPGITPPNLLTGAALDPNETLTLTVLVNVNPSVVSGTDIVNVASVTSSEVPTPTNSPPVTNTVIIPPPPPGQPNLVIDKAVEPTGFVSPNDPLTYTIVVLNNGDTRATDVTISDTLPSEVTPVSASVDPSGNGSPGITPPNLLTGAALDPNETLTLTLLVNVNPSVVSGTDIVNVASVTSSEVPTPTNSPPVTNTVVGLTVLDPAITKEPSVDQAFAGDIVDFNILMTNPSPPSTIPATQVVLTDPFPEFLEVLNYSYTSTSPGLVNSANLTTDTVTLVGNQFGLTETVLYTLTLNIPTLSPNEQVSVFVRTRVKNAVQGQPTIRNVATMDFDGGSRTDDAIVDVLVPGGPPPSGGGGDDDDDDDDTSVTTASAPPPGPPSAPPPPTATPAPLPVLFLPETGVNPAPTSGGLIALIAATSVLMLGLMGARLRRKMGK